MFHLLHRADQTVTPRGSVEFEGAPYGAGLSFFLDRAAPGDGPPLHLHPYPETWIVTRGSAAMTIGDETISVVPGDIIVVPAATPHRFQATGDEWLEIICLHPSDRFRHTWLG